MYYCILQHKMFGLASLQMAQTLRTHLSSVRLGGPGLQIPDASSSGALSPSALRIANMSNNDSSSSCRNGKGGGRGERGRERGRDSKSSHQTQAKVSGKSLENSSESQPVVPDPPTGKRQNDAVHTFSWRDLFDIVVRWRQVREFTV